MPISGRAGARNLTEGGLPGSGIRKSIKRNCRAQPGELLSTGHPGPTPHRADPLWGDGACMALPRKTRIPNTIETPGVGPLATAC